MTEILFGCKAVADALSLEEVDHCASCHSEMEAYDEGVIDCRHGLWGELDDGREYEEVCCGIPEAIKARAKVGG